MNEADAKIPESRRLSQLQFAEMAGVGRMVISTSKKVKKAFNRVRYE